MLGVASAYFGGRIDNIIQRFMDILLAFPLIVLALVVVAALKRFVIGGVDVNLVFAIAIPIIPRVARVVRAAALSVRVMPYVDAARAAGYSNSRIIFRHMAPNVVAPYLIMLTAFIAQAILAEASLSFLGLGVAGTDRRLGPDAVRQCRGLLPRSAVDDPVSRRRDFAGGLRVQPVRR